MNSCSNKVDSMTITYSLADQCFSKTKSVGIFNVSTKLLEKLAQSSRIGRLSVLSNSSLKGKLRLPANVNIQCHNEATINMFGRIIWDQWGAYAVAKNSNNHWLFLPKGFGSFLKPPPVKLAAYIYDAMHDFYRTNYPGVIPWLENMYFIECLRKTLKYSNVIFTDSDFAKDELMRLAYKFELKSPLVITAGVGFARIKNVDTVTKKGDFLLVLTSALPHKLTEKAISFIDRWKKQTGFSGSVKLVGSLPDGVHLLQHAGWQHHHRIPETMYMQFLTEARALLFFSAYEGFGMPPVEAMIAGTCPVFSDLPVTNEVMGGRGFSFSNESYESFVQAMTKALCVPETQIELWAEQLLERHNWDKVVERIVNGLAQASEVNNQG